jgi:2-oxoglutarate ferredoxin oxidoreductase subunit beta
VISPCVAFNNHPGSTKSYDYVREHNEAVNRIDFVTTREPITADYPPGSVQEIVQHDGTVLRLRKVDESYDVNDRIAAMNYSQAHHAKGEVVTGLLFVDPNPEDLHGYLHTVEKPFNQLDVEDLCPGSSMLAKINASLR